MDFDFSPEQLEFQSAVAQFARSLGRDLAARDARGQFSRDDWQACADFGIQGMAVPDVYGGSGPRDLISCLLAMEALGQGCPDNGLTLGLNAQMWTVQQMILRHGTEQQKQRLLPKLCQGQWIAADALTEPEHGSDLAAMETLASRCEGGYRLSGTKTLITFGPIADLVLVFATLDPALGRWGITAFLVESSWPHFHAGPIQDKMGLRTLPLGQIQFDGCLVPEASRLGPEGAGASLMSSSLELERCCILASQLGCLQRQCDTAIDVARTRQQFGQPIGKFQSVSNRIVDMKVRLEISRLLLYKVAWLKTQGRSAGLEAAMLKLYLSEASVQSGLDAIRIHGGRGYLTETGVERDLRDAIGSLLYAGTSDIQRNLIAGLLGL